MSTGHPLQRNNIYKYKILLLPLILRRSAITTGADRPELSVTVTVGTSGPMYLGIKKYISEDTSSRYC